MTTLTCWGYYQVLDIGLSLCSGILWVRSIVIWYVKGSHFLYVTCGDVLASHLVMYY